MSGKGARSFLGTVLSCPLTSSTCSWSAVTSSSFSTSLIHLSSSGTQTLRSCTLRGTSSRPSRALSSFAVNSSKYKPLTPSNTLSGPASYLPTSRCPPSSKRRCLLGTLIGCRHSTNHIRLNRKCQRLAKSAKTLISFQSSFMKGSTKSVLTKISSSKTCSKNSSLFKKSGPSFLETTSKPITSIWTKSTWSKFSSNMHYLFPTNKPLKKMFLMSPQIIQKP